MRAINELAELLAQLPGVGPRQARRIVQYILMKDVSFRDKLAFALTDITKRISQCASCFRFDEASEKKLCRLCADSERDPQMLMVVEKDVDIEGVESSGAYRGRYFVLGGLIAMARQRRANENRALLNSKGE